MNTNINDGAIHKVLFSKGKLYLDGNQIGGEDVNPDKDITFEFMTAAKVEEPIKQKDNSVLEISVVDRVAGMSVGPGQL